MSRFLCREFFFLEQEFGKIFTYLSVYPVSENVTVRIQQRRARRVVSLTQNRLYAFISIIYNTLLRERERRPVSIYIVSRVRLLFARVLYCGVVRASKIISLRVREKKEK